MSNKLRKGLILLNTSSLGKGVVIDWGISGRFHEYIPSEKELPSIVRVWTKGEIELWPLTAVRVEENWFN